MLSKNERMRHLSSHRLPHLTPSENKFQYGWSDGYIEIWLTGSFRGWR